MFYLFSCNVMLSGILAVKIRHICIDIKCGVLYRLGVGDVIFPKRELNRHS